jgi:TonB-linked SusC/RagA family outer membrane protein
MNINRLVKRTEFVQSFKHSVFGRLLSVLMLLFVVQFFGAQTLAAQSKKVTLHVVNAPLATVLNDLSKQTHYKFFYSDNTTDVSQKITLNVVNKPLNEVLTQIFEGKEIGFQLKNNQILLFKKKATTQIPVASPVSNNLIRVTGKVTDDKGQALPGVTIVAKGTTTGTITDVDGNYFFDRVPSNATLVFSFVGMQSQVVNVDNKIKVNVMLSEMATGLNEVVVVGYGTQKKETVTGSISTVGDKALVETPVANISNALVGLVPGLSATQSSGEPGDDAATIRIRGVSTLNGSGQDPLVIIDGVQSTLSIMNSIDANEIADISVLKDASATAVYGVRGANGVILVTTKRGKSGEPQINFSATYGFTKLASELKMLDSYDYALYRNEAIQNDNTPNATSSLFTTDDLWKFQNDRDFTPAEVNAMNLTPDAKKALLASPAVYYTSHDYFNEQYGGVSPEQQYNVNISGGGEQMRYFTSVGYFSQDGVFKDANYGGADANSSYDRYNFRSNYDFDVLKNLKLTVDLSGQFAKNHGILGNPQDGDITGPDARHKAMMEGVLDEPPYAGPGIVDGKLVEAWAKNSYSATIGQRGAGGYSPITNLLERPTLTTFNTNVNAIIKLTHTLDYLTKGLSLSGTVSFNDNYTKGVYRFQPIPYYTLTRNPANPVELLFTGGAVGATSINDNYNNYKTGSFYLEGVANYIRSFGKHSVTGMILYNAQKTFDPSLLFQVPSGLMGVSGRATYDFDQRYLAEVDMGYNGSENFPPGKRFGFFPAYSAGWIISDEPFFPKNSLISWLKIKGSYGEVGNDKIGGKRFLYLPNTWGYGNNGYLGGYYFGNSNGGSSNPYYNGASETTVGNPFVTWERAKKTNYSLEMNFLRNRLTFIGDVFQEKRDNILWTLGTVPATVGANLPPANVGRVENGGYEIQLGWADKIGKIGYSIQTSVSYAKNKILYMSEPNNAYSWMDQTGFSIGQYKGYKTDGFYNTEQEVINHPYQSFAGNKVQLGDIRYVDINGDGIIDSKDQVPIGYSNLPRFAFNATLSVSYKGFAVSMLFIGTAEGSFPITNFYLMNPFYQTDGNAMQFQYDGRWTPEKVAEGITPTFPRASMNTYTSENGQFSDFWLKSTDFIRLKNMEISYTFNKNSFLERVKAITSLQLFVRGNNLYTWTKMMGGMDPEQQDSGGASSGFVYPMVSTYSFGINAQF